MRRIATAVVATVLLTGLAAPAHASSSYDQRMVAWNDCTTFERHGPFWGRVLLGGRNPDRFPPCGARPVDTARAKWVGPAIRR